MTKIYTKTGDKGKTSLFDGTRVAKNNIRIETYGTFDELSSVLAVANSFLSKEKKLQKMIIDIQQDLLDLGGHLANPQNKITQKFILHIDERVVKFEKHIDEMTEKLPILRNFIIFSGNSASAFLQQARSVSRRAERRLVTLSQEENVDGSLLRYFNRLSDLLFTMSRFTNRHMRKKETIWKPFR